MLQTQKLMVYNYYVLIMSVKSEYFLFIIRDPEYIASRYENHSSASVMKIIHLGLRASARDVRNASECTQT